MTLDLNAIGAATQAAGFDQTKAVAAGGDFEFTPHAPGPCRLRFVGYIEVGKQEITIPGKPVQVKPQVHLLFEIIPFKTPDGVRHERSKNAEGQEFPKIITIKLNQSQDERSGLFKLFTRMNYAGKATHFVQLLGSAYLGNLYHRKYKGRDGKERVAEELHSKEDGYSIRPPRVQDMETMEMKEISVGSAIAPIRAFVWGLSDPEMLKGMWDSLYIDGEYPEVKDESGKVVKPAKSKNVWQNTIKSAKNFEGSPIYSLLVANGQKVDVPVSTQDFDDAEEEPPFTPDAKTSNADPLAGIA